MLGMSQFLDYELESDEDFEQGTKELFTLLSEFSFDSTISFSEFFFPNLQNHQIKSSEYVGLVLFK